MDGHRVHYPFGWTIIPTIVLDINMEPQSTIDYLKAAWLAQAASVDLNIPTSAKYVVIGSRIQISLTFNDWCIKYKDTNLSYNVYLFIAPAREFNISSMPHFSLHDPPYFWSMDPLRAIPMSQETQKLLGTFPSFQPYIHGDNWDDLQYLAVSKYIRYCGFDPSESKYAQAQGYPIFEVLDDEGFEIVDLKGFSQEDSLDDEVLDDNWEFVSRQTPQVPIDGQDNGCTTNIALEQSKAGMNYQTFLELHHDYQRRGTHNYSTDCETLGKSLQMKARLRRTQSLTLFSSDGSVDLPITERIRNAIRAKRRSLGNKMDADDHTILDSLIWGSPYRIPHQYIDYCLDLINY
ncbi:hypothetical protein BDP27DRAFT_1352690 [Rhodocollybia butyracea]|uniref:Uncharacterized protein n=1 Tax=Rhodocollybia butyracea TaxID=206335 RepID=A0A9P5P670_9AGAR|nr:hypothetical protein BDP27DRAFT_1352690 [Rhodocollybia butyracea]